MCVSLGLDETSEVSTVLTCDVVHHTRSGACAVLDSLLLHLQGVEKVLPFPFPLLVSRGWSQMDVWVVCISVVLINMLDPSTSEVCPVCVCACRGLRALGINNIFPALCNLMEPINGGA